MSDTPTFFASSWSPVVLSKKDTNFFEIEINGVNFNSVQTIDCKPIFDVEIVSKTDDQIRIKVDTKEVQSASFFIILKGEDHEWDWFPVGPFMLIQSTLVHLLGE